MTDARDDRLSLDDPDRLPWLEPVDDEEDEPGISVARVLGLVLAGLVILGLVVGGGYWLRTKQQAAQSEAIFIPAKGGDYKVPANEVDGGEGKSFSGEGDSSYAMSEGKAREGTVDTSKAPEAPLAGVARGSAAVAPVAGQAASSVSATVKDTSSATGAATSRQADMAKSAGGPAIQLGAYASAGVARDAWTKLSGRFDYLAPLTHRVEEADVGGRTVHRLRASVGSAAEAANLCGRLKVAGENCLVVR